MSKRKLITAKHCAGGLNLGTGAFNLKPEENRESRNMEYTIEGAAASSLGHLDPGWDWGEDDKQIDGLYRVALYPDVIFAAVNGKIKYVDATVMPQSSGVPYTVDTGVSLTAGEPVVMKDYRGMLYYANGTENVGRVAISKLASQLTTTPADETINVRTGNYDWTLSSQGTTEYYLRLSAANPELSEPTSLTINGSTATKGTVTTLAAGRWGYDNSDSLGYRTIYVRLADGTDPDTKADGYVVANYADEIILEDATGYKFNVSPVGGSSIPPYAADKVYIEGDEIDYTGISDYGYGDKLYGASNIATTHEIGAYVTQYSSIPTSYPATCLEFWRDTLWVAGMPDEPGVLRYGETIGVVGDILTGNIHDLSGGNNYIIGDGGEITALHATEERLYVFMKDKVHFIATQFNSSAVEQFTTSRLFTGVYGCPNPQCVTSMEDVVIFFTGNRLIRIGYDPNGQQLIPDENFDREILPLLQDADIDQSNARLTYNPHEKILRLKYISNGVAKVIKYHKQLDKYSGFSDEEASCYVVHGKNTYFGSTADDVTFKIGASIDSDGENTQHRYLNGRVNGGNQNWKMFIRGMVKGKKNRGSTLYLLTKVDNKNVGAAREITDTQTDVSDGGTPLGETVVGGDEIGLSGDTNNVFPFTYRFLLGKRGKDYSFAISSDESGAVWEVDSYEIEYEEFEAEPRTHY